VTVSPSTSESTTTIGAAFAERTVAAAGFDIRYFEAGDGAPLVYLPGAGGPTMSIALDLLAQQFRVIMIELPGWGAQPNDAADFDVLAGQVADAITAIGLDSFHLMGTSLGGACALHLTALFPERVISLTLEAPAKFRVDSKNPAELPPEKFVPAFRTHPERCLPMKPLTAEFLAKVWPTVERLMGSGDVDQAFIERIRTIPNRTLVLFGRNDGVINPSNGPTYRANMKNSVLFYVYDAAHDIQADRPEAFADVVTDFLRRGMNFLVNDHDGLINP
jgi:pimeloyl-ACP methyl ester carboxylesterase